MNSQNENLTHSFIHTSSHLRILFVITSLDYGGTQKQLYYIIKWLKKNKIAEIVELPNGYDEIEPVIISLKQLGRMKEKFLSLGIPVYSLGMPSESSFLSIFLLPVTLFSFLFYLLKFRPHIIHSFLFQANIISRIVGKMVSFCSPIFSPRRVEVRYRFNNGLKPDLRGDFRSGKSRYPRIICSERVAEKEKLWHLKISQWTNFLVDKIVVNSGDLKQFVVETQKVNSEKVVVIPNIIDSEEIKITKTSDEIRSELNISKNTFMILSVGRLHKQKGYDLLLKVAKKTIELGEREKDRKEEGNNNIIFVIIGDGEEYQDLIKRLKDYRLEDCVKFIGYKENVYDYINACDLFLLTSYWEGSPNVILEAVYLKKFVISTDVSGVREILVGRENGFVVPLYDEKEKIINEIYEKILEVFINRYTSITNSHLPLTNHFPENVIKKLLVNYSKL